MRKALSFALLAVGVLLIVFGIREADSAVSEFSEFFTGRPTEEAMGLLIAGGAALVVGLVGLFAPFGRR